PGLRPRRRARAAQGAPRPRGRPGDGLSGRFPSATRTSVRVMDREQLERWLAEGLSVEEIARRVERHPSTAWYWMEGWRLRSSHADRHAPRGSLAREDLERLVGRDLTVRVDRGRGRSQSDHRALLAEASRP